MPKDTELIVVKETFITKLTKFLKNLFLKEQKSKVFVNTEEIENSKKEEFAKSIKVEEDKEMQRLLNLQSMLRNKQIEEKDIIKEDEIKLRSLYEKQISKLKEKIEEHRQVIIKIKSKRETNKV